MKKLQIRFTYFALITSLSLGFLFTSCSKDDADDVVLKGKIDDAVGTYKGTLYHKTIPRDYYDAIIIVTKEGNDKLKVSAKTGEEYSNITSRTFTVEVGDFFGMHPIDVTSLSGTTGGYFSYYGESKSIDVFTTKQFDEELDFAFEGVKQ